MEIRIFDVEQGFCAYVIADNGNVILIDCGMNSSTGFSPSTYLVRNGCRGIEKLVITNFDEDHIADLPALIRTGMPIQVLTRNNTISGEALRSLKLEGGPISAAMESFLSLHTTYNQPVTSPPNFAGVVENFFFNPYPSFTDTNNLSLVAFLHYQNIHIVFPGDLEKDGFLELLKNDAFKQALRETNVYVASHHGRDNGCCEEVANYLQNVFYVVISDKGYQYDTQKTLPFYSRIAKGGPFGQEPLRKVLTTRCDGRIDFEFSPGSWGPR